MSGQRDVCCRLGFHQNDYTEKLLNGYSGFFGDRCVTCRKMFDGVRLCLFAKGLTLDDSKCRRCLMYFEWNCIQNKFYIDFLVHLNESHTNLCYMCGNKLTELDKLLSDYSHEDCIIEEYQSYNEINFL